MTDIGPSEDQHPALGWLISREAELVGSNLRWVALTEDGPVGEARELGELIERFGRDGPLFHYVAFAVDEESGQVLLPEGR